MAEAPEERGPNIEVDGDYDNLLFKEERDGEHPKCIKLRMAHNLLAYINKQSVGCQAKPIECDSELLEKVTSNYLIVKRILSNLPWQEKMLCKLVCTTWYSAIKALQKEQLSPEDFVIDFDARKSRRIGIKYKNSGVQGISTEPMVVLTFAKSEIWRMAVKCKTLNPNPCLPCDSDHCLLDVTQHFTSSPKCCMLTVKSKFVSYMPLRHSVTFPHSITGQMLFKPSPFLGGISIPVLPGVEFNVIDIKSAGDMHGEFYSIVDNISQNRTIKGVLAFVTEKYLLASVEDIVFLNYFKEVQADTPYALGGCIVEDVFMLGKNDFNNYIGKVSEGAEYVTENLISVGLFTIPKNVDHNAQADKQNFEVYSLVLDSLDWTKAKIEKAITEFSCRVPHFENSVALKLSCVGRDKKHDMEQSCFRAVFPTTRVVGCYGNGELGLNHPELPAEEPVIAKKRLKPYLGPQLGIMYSYSTVFFYIGWGKITRPAGSVSNQLPSDIRNPLFTKKNKSAAL